MLTSIFHTGAFPLRTVVPAMAVALLLGILIAWIYKTGCDYAGSFSIILCILPLLVTTIIMIVNGNLGVSVTVLGAFGLIRFRSAPGTAREIGFLFFAMAVGLAIGMGFLSLAFLIAISVGATILALEKADFGGTTSTARELRVTIPEDLSYNGIFDDLFERYTKTAHLERVRTAGMGTLYELSYRLKLKKPDDEKELIDALRCRNGNLTITLGLVAREKNEL